jgi:hypothetical protein
VTDRPQGRLAVLLVLLLVVSALAACGDDGSSTTGPAVSFGEGDVPPSFPEDFPIPSGAIIGSTLVDTINDRSEMEIRIGAAGQAVAEFYLEELPASGYEITSDTTETRLRMIGFADGDLVGAVVIAEADPSVTRAVIEINRS